MDHDDNDEEEESQLGKSFTEEAPLIRMLRWMSRRCKAVDADLAASGSVSSPAFSALVEPLIAALKRELVRPG